MFSKFMFGASLALFYDDRLRYVVYCFIFSTLFSLLPTVLALKRILIDTDDSKPETSWIEMYIKVFLDIKFIVKACFGLGKKVDPKKDP